MWRSLPIAAASLLGCFGDDGGGFCQEPLGFYRLTATEMPGGTCGAPEPDVLEWDGWGSINGDCAGMSTISPNRCSVDFEMTCPLSGGGYASLRGDMASLDGDAAGIDGTWMATRYDAEGAIECSSTLTISARRL